jgi:hypothetical protein
MPMTASDVAAAHELLTQLSAVLRKRSYALRTVKHSHEEEAHLLEELSKLGVTNVREHLNSETQEMQSKHPDDQPLTSEGKPT